MAVLDDNHTRRGLTIQTLNPAAPSFYPAMVHLNYELPSLPHPNPTIANITPAAVDTTLLTFFHSRRHQPQLCSPSNVQYFAYGYTASPFQYTHYHTSPSQHYHLLRTPPQPPSLIQYDRCSTLQAEPSSIVMSSSYTRQAQSTTPRPARVTPTQERKTDGRNSCSSNSRFRSRKEGCGGYWRNCNSSNGRYRSRKEVSEGSTEVDNTSTKTDRRVISCGSSTGSSTSCHASSGREHQRPNRSMGYHDVVPVDKDGRETTVMIRNIPNKYVREELIQFIDNHCLVENQKEKAIHTSDTAAPGKEPVVSAFDFLYLPMDFGTGLNKGYAFVNFTNPRAVWKFHLACNGHTWRNYSSKKRIHVACAKLQGKKLLVKHFEPKAFPSEHCLPVRFSPALDGSNNQSVQQTTVGNCSKYRPTQEWRKRN